MVAHGAPSPNAYDGSVGGAKYSGDSEEAQHAFLWSVTLYRSVEDHETAAYALSEDLR